MTVTLVVVTPVTVTLVTVALVANAVIAFSTQVATASAVVRIYSNHTHMQCCY
jgi:hypothetical protein